jgi:hypothetical protein
MGGDQFIISGVLGLCESRKQQRRHGGEPSERQQPFHRSGPLFRAWPGNDAAKSRLS